MANDSVKALRRAIAVVGGQSHLARELSALTGKPIRQGHIWAWLNRTLEVPPEIAPYIEAVTSERGDPVSRTELCPSFPWGKVSGTPAQG